METLYFLGIALGGGFMAIFLSAGWSSFKHKKIPEKGILFRWFIAGLVASGLIAYAWIFGSGGDVGEVMQRMGGALDLENVMKLAASIGTAAVAVGSNGDSANYDKKDGDGNDGATDLKLGMPNF